MENVKAIVMKVLAVFKKPVVMKTTMFSLVLMLTATQAFAADAGMDSFDSVVDVVARWLGRIGLVVAFFGAVQLALGFKQDDADGKIRGMKTLASGFLVFGITQSLNLFGL
jgi:hypothetical protein